MEAPRDDTGNGVDGHPAGRTDRSPRDPEVDVGEPGANQVRIAVEAFCLDFNDIDTIRGRYGLLKFEPPSSSAWRPQER